MRRSDWTVRLIETVEAAASRPFEYGEADCGLFAARCIDAICENSARASELAALYQDERSALRFVAEEGGVEAAVTKRLGQPIPASFASRGDVCLMPGVGFEALGICVGSRVAAMSQDGMRYAPLADVIKAWRVD